MTGTIINATLNDRDTVAVLKRLLGYLCISLWLASCGGTPDTQPESRVRPGPAPTPKLSFPDSNHDGAPDLPLDVSGIPEPVPRVEPLSKYGNPRQYEVFGKSYTTLTSSHGYVERGIASWYGTKFHNRRTSSGEPYDIYGITAAHKSLPLPTFVQVTNLENGRKLIIRVNDRGPFHDNRVIDLSYAAATKLGILATGTGLVEVRAIDPRDRSRPTLTVAQASTPRLARGKPAPLSRQSLAASRTRTHDPDLYLQMGAYSSRSNAESMRTRLLQVATAAIDITESRHNDATIYRVRLGPIKDVSEADSMSRHIVGSGLGTPLVVIE